jgi:hypothetical protein
MREQEAGVRRQEKKGTESANWGNVEHRTFNVQMSPRHPSKRTVTRAAAAAAALLLLAPGCGRPVGSGGHFDLVIGSFGHTAGKFKRPRGIVHDAKENVIFVVDWDGRIQKFTPDGQFRASWIMPDIEQGKPEDLCMSRSGNLLVADTHYSRIVEFTPGGEQVRSFGSYGRQPGQFIYPVGICCDRDGNIYVAEYGENDRVQKFTPDGVFIGSWGSFGSAPGQFQRPSGIAIAADDQVFVGDAVNHRVQVFDRAGKLIRIIGKEGTGPGEFRYPYDVAVDDQHLYVLEFGNHRVQKLTRDGKPLGMLGQRGRGDGCFASPWRCALVKGALYVSDTDNSRVVRLSKPF